MLRIGSSAHCESRIRMLRVARRGDRHDPKELTVSLRLEGDFGAAFSQGRTDGLVRGDTLKTTVHQLARAHGSAEIEPFGLALCEILLGTYPQVTRARADIVEQAWPRVHASGRSQGQAFSAVGPERQTAAITSNGSQVAVVSGVSDLTLMRTTGFSPPDAHGDGPDDDLQRLLVASLSARWAYRSPDVTFGPFRHGVRAAIVDTFATHAARSVHHLLYGIGEVVLATYEDIADVTLSVDEYPYAPADPFSAGLGDPVDLFVALEERVGRVEVTVERQPR